MYRQRRVGPVDPAFLALFGRLRFTVRRHKSNQDSHTHDKFRLRLLSFECILVKNGSNYEKTPTAAHSARGALRGSRNPSPPREALSVWSRHSGGARVLLRGKSTWG